MSRKSLARESVACLKRSLFLAILLMSHQLHFSLQYCCTFYKLQLQLLEKSSGPRIRIRRLRINNLSLLEDYVYSNCSSPNLRFKHTVQSNRNSVAFQSVIFASIVCPMKFQKKEEIVLVLYQNVNVIMLSVRKNKNNLCLIYSSNSCK